MTKYPLKFSVQVEKKIPGAGTDFFGDPVGETIATETVAVFGWAITSVAETATDSVMRLVNELQLFAPSGTIKAPDTVVLPDGGRWEVHGTPENYDNNPWFSPGLEVVKCRQISG